MVTISTLHPLAVAVVDAIHVGGIEDSNSSSPPIQALPRYVWATTTPRA